MKMYLNWKNRTYTITCGKHTFTGNIPDHVKPGLSLTWRREKLKYWKQFAT